MVASSVFLVIATALLFVGSAKQASAELNAFEALRTAPFVTVTAARAVLGGGSVALPFPVSLVVAVAAAIRELKDASDRDGITLRAQLKRARNWGIIMVGGLCALAGESIELAHRV